MRRILLVVLAVVVIAGVAVLLGAFRDSRVAADVDQPLTAEQMQELVPRGRELALAGDCFGCHSTAAGPMGAGGVPIATPFGTIYSSNITPDPTFGIGGYTRAEFHRAIRDGIGRGGRNLYPAMPFVFTQVTTSDDVDALYAYIMSLPPIAREVPANTGVFVLPVRPFLNFWTLLNFPNREAPSDPARSAAWARGGYLVEGLAHCGACHTPMNVMMGPEFSKSLQGAVIEGLEAPALTPAALAGRGYDLATLTDFLATGIAPQGTSFAGMHTVTHFSTSAMERADVEAIATYLLTAPDGTMPPAKAPPAPLPEAVDPAPSTPAPGRIVYVEACSGCHGMAGEGIPNVAPAMKGNTTLALDDPRNLLSAILNGVATETFTGNQRMYAMPPFAHALSDEQIAELATWVRAEWGGQAAPVTVGQVNDLERAVD
jgi:mono/diheme cytochrome c family protein